MFKKRNMLSMLMVVTLTSVMMAGCGNNSSQETVAPSADVEAAVETASAEPIPAEITAPEETVAPTEAPKPTKKPVKKQKKTKFSFQSATGKMKFKKMGYSTDCDTGKKTVYMVFAFTNKTGEDNYWLNQYDIQVYQSGYKLRECDEYSEDQECFEYLDNTTEEVADGMKIDIGYMFTPKNKKPCRVRVVDNNSGEAKEFKLYLK